MIDEIGTLLLRADAGGRLGTGHVMRCLALAQAWQAAGGRVAFASASLPEALEVRILAEGVGVHRLPVEPGGEADTRESLALAGRLGARWAVVDGYQFGAYVQQRLVERGVRVLAVDDYGHAGSYVADLVLNQNLQADAALYCRVQPSTRLLLGLNYLLLRREFWGWRGWARQTPERARKILVTMGGTDPDNVTLQIVRALGRLASEDLEVRVVVGGGNPHRAILEDAVRQTPCVVLCVDVHDIPAQMAWADVAVSAAGSTSWELAFMGVPMLSVVLADNQAPVAAALERGRLAWSLGEGMALNPARLASALRELLADQTCRALMSRRGQALVDGRGAQRAVGEMLKMGRS
jgi:UDP-2,4-diacetamido-2,4,6-trideoxy-beta-L-altropyranose hydrolase